jgi:hypothetical protein
MRLTVRFPNLDSEKRKWAGSDDYSDVDRQMLRVMPLHAITAMYGERGLRERFSIECTRLSDPACQQKAMTACAALLHDSVEDHADDLSPNGRPGAFASLAAGFGPRVAELVEAVTHPVYAPGIDEDEQYRAHVTQSLAQHPWARLIKISDFTDNGVGVIHTTGQKAARLASKYAPLVPVLAELVALPDTPLSPEVKMHVLHQLRAAQERFAAIASDDSA